MAGPYLPQYEVYYKKLDPEGKGEIGAMEAATFLKKSGLSDEMLGKIWDMSDPGGKGFLDKTGLFVACKMVALVQSETPLTVDNARVQCPAPNFGADTAPGAPVAKVAPKKGGNLHRPYRGTSPIAHMAGASIGHNTEGTQLRLGCNAEEDSRLFAQLMAP